MPGEAPTQPSVKTVPLAAKSPFEMRVHLGEGVPEMDVAEALKTGNLAFLHSFTTGSVVDGPGVRVVAWTTSCMFRCQYCHNPDTWMLRNGIPVPLGEAVTEIRKYAQGLIAMKGGFTLSGGEPLLQHRFAARLFAAVKKMGVHTAIETNGYNGHCLSDDELRDIDLVILDMKAFTKAQHERVTGIASNEDVLELCQRLAELKRPMWLRYVLVPGLTDVASEMKAVADFGASLGVVERAEILPFHQLGRNKWERLGLNYKLGDAQAPSRDQFEAAIDVFRNAGLETA